MATITHAAQLKNAVRRAKWGAFYDMIRDRALAVKAETLLAEAKNGKTIFRIYSFGEDKWSLWSHAEGFGIEAANVVRRLMKNTNNTFPARLRFKDADGNIEFYWDLGA